MRKEYHRGTRLLVPDAEDRFAAGRNLNALLRGLRSKRAGRTSKLSHGGKNVIIRDVLIARTVKRAGAMLATGDLDAFSKIQRFRKFRMATGREFLA